MTIRLNQKTVREPENCIIERVGKKINVMKNIICFLTLLLLVLRLFSQTPEPSKDYYLKKSKTQKTVGWVMLGGGVAMTTISTLIPYKQSDDPIRFNYL